MSAPPMESAARRLADVRRRVVAAAARAGRRPEEIALVGVAKRQSAAQVAEAVRAGLLHVGESYVQEALAKLPDVEARLRATQTAPPRWHFVGRLQRNKARAVASRFDVVQTLDRARLGDALDRHAAEAGRRLQVLVQVDVSGEPQKGGIAPGDLEALLAESRRWQALDVVGLMAIPEAATAERPDASRAAFAGLRALRDRHRTRPGGEGLRELSMGMSADFEVAIEEGATIIRIGTALFGARETAQEPGETAQESGGTAQEPGGTGGTGMESA